jgi:hypothetical protein
MAFIWNSDPNPPIVAPAPVIGPEKISYDQRAVANTVNVSGLVLGTLSYNTANEGFDVIYELPSLNVRNLRAQTLTAVRATINTAFINTATINIATINTANIGTATISNGMMGVHPVQNLQIATKEYVDTLVANSIPLGGNLQLLIIAAGDLLVGVSDNTAERLAVGSNDGSVLIVGGSGNTGLRWTTRAPGATQTHRGLFIGTNYDEFLRNTEIQLVSVDEIVMNTGARFSTGWAGLTASITSNVATSGLGYLDTGVVTDNTCYEIWAVRNSSNGSQGLILHKALDRRVDATIDTTALAGTPRKIRFEHGLGFISCINVAQSFLATKSGPLTGVDLSVSRTGSPVGNCWITLEDNTASGNASGTPLATSRYMNVARLSPDISSPFPRIRFVFDATANVVSGNSYWLVVQGDYPTAHLGVNENYIQVYGTASGISAYPNGLAKNFTSNTNTWVVANTQFNPTGPADLYFRTFVEANNTEVLMPAGYDQKCLLSYTFTDNFMKLKEYRQRDHKMTMTYYNRWVFVYNSGTGVTFPGSGSDNPSSTLIDTRLQVLNLSGYVPPVPCLVTIYNYAAADASIIAVGPLSSTDMAPLTAGALTLVETSVGTLTSNVTGSGDGPTSTGPVLVEQQAFLCRYQSSSGQFYIAAMEY